MIAKCIANLKSALAGTPEAAALEILDPVELQRRLEALRLETICLRPCDFHRYQVTALLFRLPDLRPEPRFVLLNYIHSNFDFSPVTADSSDEKETVGAPASESEPLAGGTPTTTVEVQSDDTTRPPSPSADTPPRPVGRQEDLLDRFLSWVGALVS